MEQGTYLGHKKMERRGTLFGHEKMEHQTLGCSNIRQEALIEIVFFYVSPTF